MRCPVCNGELRATPRPRPKGEEVPDLLTCEQCDTRYVALGDGKLHEVAE
jgi:uncharacterized protein with PIN domain